MQGEQYVAGVHVRPLHTCLPSLGCLLSLRMVHIKCTDQEFSECLFLKLICMSALLIQVSLVLNDFDQPHCSYGKIYFGGFCAFTAPLLEKKSVCVVWSALRLIRHGRWCLRGCPGRHTRASSTSLVHRPSPMASPSMFPKPV